MKRVSKTLSFALVLALCLSLSSVAYASDENNVILVSTYLDGYSSSLGDATKKIAETTDMNWTAPLQCTYNTGQSASAPWNEFYIQFTSNYMIPAQSRVVVDWSIGCSLSDAFPVPKFKATSSGYTGLSTYVGSVNRDSYHALFTDYSVQDVSNSTTGTSQYSYHGVSVHMETVVDEEIVGSLQLSLSGFNAYGWVTYSLLNYTIYTPTGQVVKVVKDGFQQAIDGWSDDGLNDSNSQLGGALGELDQMQGDADNNLHDALGDLESPTIDGNNTSVSFITSSLSMLWGSLGGFTAVILCALFITVFNFISRYRSG